MYMSRARLYPASDIKAFIRALCRNPYREHQLIWSLFAGDPDAGRDFLFRYEQDHGAAKYFIVSRRRPHDSSGIWDIETKKFAPRLQEGWKLAFVLRANPVITVRDRQGKSRRHDVVMHEKHLMQYKALSAADRPLQHKLVTRGGMRWLTDRSSACGFTFLPDQVAVVSYQQHRAAGTGRNKRAIQFSTIDFEGVLSVQDAARFRQTLFSGIGKARAFGCGLLLVKRI